MKYLHTVAYGALVGVLFGLLDMWLWTQNHVQLGVAVAGRGAIYGLVVGAIIGAIWFVVDGRARREERKRLAWEEDGTP